MPAGLIPSLLIANRGEIACRIIRTARRLGIRTVAVYSDADAKALHVRQADEAIHIGPSPARESYLVGDRIIAAAREAGAEAIHPGYGFLSENADFAQAVTDAGLIWVGPKPDSIRAMGLKDAAKKLMAEAGVPVTPGYLGEDQSPERLQSESDAIGYPVLIKAVAGGGGKGMRRVNAAADFPEMLQSCKREAASSFGDDRVLIEKYVERPRHIEVQVFGDTHGNIVHLFERDCSLQRRHQKVIEEAPAPGMDEATRTAVCDAAVKAAKAVDYVGAGTIEFIADASEGLRADRIWFMEMNTRLQVEHPVTEEITGQDLVEWQLRVASGEPLPKRQDELAIDGWAMEARLYAEDPLHDFLPSVGRLEPLIWPKAYAIDGLRIETGVESGDSVTPFYDPMIAKVVVHGPDRASAIKRLSSALAQTFVAPLKTNSGFLYKALGDSDFRAGEVSTAFIPGKGETLLPSALPSDMGIAAAADEILHWTPGQSFQPDAWTGWRLNGPSVRCVRMAVNGKEVWTEPKEADASLVNFGSMAVLNEEGQTFAITHFRATGSSAGSVADDEIISPMPGKIISLDVRQGDTVKKGQKLLTLEAMKMEHGLTAPFDGVVAELNATEGAQVSEGTMLVRIEKGDAE